MKASVVPTWRAQSAPIPSPVRRPLAAAIALALAGGALPAFAQDIRIDVTGSNIRRVEGESALPVQVITRDEIERTGAQSVPELLQYISANASAGATNLTTVIGANVNSVATASLRGLQGQNTLVLLNGKRLAATAGEIQGVYGVNLDSIPFSAIERVEILKDGASAVYGSDAIAGVINFILRQDFRGAEVTAYYGTPTRSGGGGDKWSATGTFGFGDLAKDKYNVFVSAYYQKADPLDQNKRNFSNTSFDLATGLLGVSGNTFPAHATAFPDTSIDVGTPSFPNCAPSIYDPDIGERCFFDPAAADGVNSIPEQDTTSFFASGRWQFNPSWQLYGTAAYTKVDTRYVIQPTPISDQIFYGPDPLNQLTATFLLPPSSPYYPTALAQQAGVAGQPLNLRYRAYAIGLRDNQDEHEAFQGVAGIKGTAWNWDFDFDFIYSQTKHTQRPNGGLRPIFADPSSCSTPVASIRSEPKRQTCKPNWTRSSFARRRPTRSRAATCSRARRRATCSSCRREASPWRPASRPASRS